MLATRSRLPLRGTTALTVGDVVLTPEDAAFLLRRPRLLAHEGRHSWQYAACLGLPLLPLYGLAAGYPVVSARDRRRTRAA